MQRAFDFAPLPPRDPAARRNLVIEAGAGTGKTTAIVAEVLRLMIGSAELQPDRIVLMTFTEKAAGEIAERIRAALEELLPRLREGSGPLGWPFGSPTPLVTIDDREGALRAVTRNLEKIDGLRSQTIHSFCQSLLRTFPIEAGLDPQFRIIQGFERSLLYSQLYDEWIDAETRTNATDEVVREWETLFTHASYLFRIRLMVSGLLERRDLLEETGYDYGTLAEVSGSLREAIAALRTSSKLPKGEDAERLFAYLRAEEPPAPSSEREELDAWIDYLRPVVPAIRAVDLRGDAVVKDALRILRGNDEKKGSTVYDLLVSHRAALSLLSLTRRFLAFLDERKRVLGVADFDDLLLRTLALLDDGTVLARARAQFDYIFVDEFQDTDRTQARILRRLATDEQGRWVPGRTVVVGDPKQSIYGFRRADPETYYRITEEMKNHGAEGRQLTHQYRSDPPLLEIINAAFLRLFPEQPRDPNVFRPPYTPLVAGRGESRRALDARFTLLAVDNEEKADRYLDEADAIARWITAHRDGGPHDLQRFAILFRRLTVLDDYLDTLERYGIDYVLPPTRLFLDRPAPVDLVAMLRAIALPFDKGAQISAARSPYFGLTDVEILDQSGEAWQSFEAAITAFRARAPQLTVSQLADLVIDSRGIEAVYAATADGQRHLRHLEHIRSIAFEYDLRTGGSVRQFVEEIVNRRDEPEESEPSLVDESQNAVRILTVHTAKGLEFDTVILPDLAFQKPGSEMQVFPVEEPKSMVLTGGPETLSAVCRKADGERLKKITGLRDEAEQRRLFYVAVTRAKSDVVFVCPTEARQNVGFRKFLLDAIAIDPGALPEMWDPHGRRIHETAIGPVAFERIAREEGQRPSSVRRRLRDADLQSRLEQEIVPVEAWPVEPPELLDAGEIAARRAGSANRAAGILLHRVLELWDGSGSPVDLVEPAAVEAAADAQAAGAVRRRLEALESSPMLARVRAAETLGREMPLHLEEEGTLVERRVDRLIREGDAVTVVDYKSGRGTTERIARDRLQVGRYCAAIERLTGRPCRGALWYIDMESDQVVAVDHQSDGAPL